MEPSTKHFRKRNAILQYLQNTKVHPSAETVYADPKQTIPDLSMGTVYRNLNLFRQQGLANVIATVHGVDFICRGCDSVTDLMQMEIPQSLCTEASRQSGGDAQVCSLSFTGLCNQCKNSGETA